MLVKNKNTNFKINKDWVAKQIHLAPNFQNTDAQVIIKPHTVDSTIVVRPEFICVICSNVAWEP